LIFYFKFAGSIESKLPSFPGNSCAYLDTTESDSASAVRGLTTRFEVIKGQFMNRVTGVKEGTGESSE
jgi:hypothetical protein